MFRKVVLVPLALAAISAAADAELCEKKLQSASDSQVLAAHAFAKLVNPEKLKAYIQYLNGEKPLWGGMELKDRSSKENREVARQSIALTLRILGYRPEFEIFEDGTNIVVEIPGQELAFDVLELGAHYDTVDRGADDNAAGVALLIHLADLFKSHPPQRTVRLVFYDLEEDECQGSCHHVNQLSKDPRRFVGALVADSLGYFPQDLNPKVVVAEIGTYEPQNLPLARELFYQVRRLPVDRGVQLSAEIVRVDGEMADHGPYWKEKQPAILIARPYGKKFDSPHNHGQSDTTENMNWDYYTKAARLFAELAGYAARVSMNAETLTGLTEAAQEDLTFSQSIDGQHLPDTLLPDEPLTDPEDEKPAPQKPKRGWFYGLFFGYDDEEV